jgi:hypothetical protein
MLFRVYYSKYAQQETFDGSRENIGETPVDEVLVIVQWDLDHGRKLVSGGDFYCWDPEFFWIPCDRETKDQYIRRPGLHRYLRGVMVHHEEWNRVVKLAREDPDFPPQSALHRYETKDHF